MQVDFDVDVLLESMQAAAMRRGLFVAYMPALEKWTVNTPVGEVVGTDTQLEKLFGILDEWAIVNEKVDAQWLGDHLLLHPGQADFATPQKRVVV